MTHVSQPGALCWCIRVKRICAGALNGLGMSSERTCTFFFQQGLCRNGENSCENMSIERCTFVQRFFPNQSVRHFLWEETRRTCTTSYGSSKLSLCCRLEPWPHATGSGLFGVRHSVCRAAKPTCRQSSMAARSANWCCSCCGWHQTSTDPTGTDTVLSQHFHPPDVHKEWRVEVAAPMETAAGPDQSHTRSRSLGTRAQTSFCSCGGRHSPWCQHGSRWRQEAMVVSMFLQQWHWWECRQRARGSGLTPRKLPTDSGSSFRMRKPWPWNRRSFRRGPELTLQSDMLLRWEM